MRYILFCFFANKSSL